MVQLSVRPAAIVLYKGKLLVVKSSYSGKMYYLAPGGGIEGKETIFECCERETFEETGLKVKAEKIICANDYITANGRCLNIFILAKLKGKNSKLSRGKKDGGKVLKAEWKTLEELSRAQFHPKKLLKLLKDGKVLRTGATYFND